MKSPFYNHGHFPVVFSQDESFIYKQIMLTEKSAKRLSEELSKIIAQQNIDLEMYPEATDEDFMVTLDEDIILDVYEIKGFYSEEEVKEDI